MPTFRRKAPGLHKSCVCKRLARHLCSRRKIYSVSTLIDLTPSVTKSVAPTKPSTRLNRAAVTILFDFLPEHATHGPFLSLRNSHTFATKGRGGAADRWWRRRDWAQR